MNYIINFFSSFIILLLTFTLFSWFIDPYAMYWSPQIKHVNEIKPESGKRARITKAYQVNKIKPQILIVGNSRVEMGINPSNDVFGSKRVYNQGIPGAGISMQVDYAIDAILNNTEIEQILMSLDFIDFLITEKQAHRFKENPNDNSKPNYNFRLSSQDLGSNFAKISRLKEQMKMCFSLDAFTASINTILKQGALVNSTNPYGYNNALSYVDIMNSEGIKPLFTQKINQINARLSSQQWQINAKSHYPFSSVYLHLKRLINTAKEKKIKLTFFINPYHYSYLHVLKDNHQWGNFLLWKKNLVDFFEIQQDSNHILWDFSGQSKFINENVPLQAPKKSMKWFWEPAHYKEELGVKILESLFEITMKSQTNFGRKLNKENITNQLKNDQVNLSKTTQEWHSLMNYLTPK